MYRRMVRILAGLCMVAAVASAPAVTGAWSGRRWWSQREALWTLDVVLVLLGLTLLIYAWWSHGSLTSDLRYMMRRHRRTLALLVGGGAMLGLLLAGEAVCFVINWIHDPGAVQFKGEHLGNLFQRDDLLGTHPKPNTATTVTKYIGAQRCYTVTYTIDSAGRRVTPSTAPADSDTIVLFFGGSCTFGEGVNDEESLPACYARLAPRWPVYNYGYSGYGPNSSLALIRDGRLDDVVAGKHVIAVFQFIDSHIDRVVGTMHVVTLWGHHMPCYELNDADQLVYYGCFADARPKLHWVYALLSKSQVLRFFQVDLPLRRQAHDHLAVRVLDEIAAELSARSRSCDFYLLLHPIMERGPELKAHLRNPQIHVLDYAGLFGADEGEYRIRLDGHPTPKAHELVARRLAHDLSGEP